LKNLNKASKETLEALPDIGPEVSKSIYKWFQEKRNQELIDALLKAGVEILPSKRFNRKLIKKTFVITGTLKSLTRSEAQKKIRLLGGSPLTSLSLKTNYLVVGENPGSKLQKAKKLGVKIIDEKEFLRIIK
jgi:DNA ligase (NAD+)